MTVYRITNNLESLVFIKISLYNWDTLHIVVKMETLKVPYQKYDEFITFLGGAQNLSFNDHELF